MDSKLAHRIKMRKQAKIESPFGRGNFAEGTVAVFESPSLKFLDEKDRKWPHQRYETFTAKVVSIMANGPDSFVAVLDRPNNLIEGSNDCINIAWCREIVKYGEGKTTIRSHDLGNMAFWHQDVLVTLPGKASNYYQMHSIRAFLIFMLSRHPRYCGDNGDHIYDIDKLVRMVAGHFQRINPFTCAISKKKFHSIFKKAMVKCRTSRRKAQHEESESMARMYEEEAMHELEYLD